MKNNNSGRQLPLEQRKRNRVRSLIENDLDFLCTKGFIAPKFLSKTPKIPNIRPLREIKKRKISSENVIPAYYHLDKELKNSTKLYEDFQKFIKPERDYINNLCPYKQMQTPKDTGVSGGLASPQSSYFHYKMHSMSFLTVAGTRIKKAKEYIQVARKISIRYC